MLRYMKPSSTHWGHLWLYCLALCASAGFWAGSAAAQADDGGWFDDSSRRAAEQERQSADPAPPSEPDYSPPPPNFQERPAAPPAATEEVIEDDPEAHQKAVEEFAPRLEPYGRWVDDSRYGRVWVPSRTIVGSEFVPYSTGGHWSLTPDDDWIWVSDYPFGSITFHYGRWVWTTGSYWGWVPGYVYAPAWVDFHVGAVGYIGWAPLAPRYVWRSGAFVSVGLWGAPRVVFCPTRYVFVRSMPRYIVRDRVRVRSMVAQTRVYRGPRYLSRGPRPSELRIPRSALPERRVPYRRVIAEPQLTSRSRTGSRLQLADGARSSSRAVAPYRSRERSRDSNAQLPSRSRSYQTAPRSYASDGRFYSNSSRYARPEAQQRAPARGVQPRALPPGAQRGSVWGSERREQQRGSAWGSERREQQRGSVWGSDRREPSRSAAPPRRTLPQRSAPAIVPRDRQHQRSPFGFDGGARGSVRGGGAPAVVPRATRPAPDARGGGGRRYRRGDDSSSGDSRARGRERYGSGR